MYQNSETDGHVSQDAERRSRPFGSARIFSVPEYSREVRPAAYAPLILVIGPYHRDRESAEIDECKTFSAKLRNPAFHRYVHESIRRFAEMYDRKMNVDSASLSLMLAKDASLLSDLLIEYADRSYPTKNCVYDDYVLPRRHFWPILRDLFLMENQIPMELLAKSLVEIRQNALQPTVNMLVKYVYPFRTKTDLPRIDYANCHHLLDCFYQACTWKVAPDPKADRSDVRIPSATQLRAVGIRISPTYGDLNSIKFNARAGILHVPEIKMYSETETWFRNLIAYEQCRNDLSVHWCSYIRIMTCLVDTPEDVKLLMKRKVLISLTGSNEAVSEVWNKLGVNVELFLTGRDKGIMETINVHCSSTWKIWAAEMLHLYFSTPWSFISLLAAIVVLIMEFLQTYYTLVPSASSSSDFAVPM